MDDDTGCSRGWGFVEMLSATDAQRAIAGLNGRAGDGHVLAVLPAYQQADRQRSRRVPRHLWH
jgi:cold-inducible RNA-binding protein